MEMHDCLACGKQILPAYGRSRRRYAEQLFCSAKCWGLYRSKQAETGLVETKTCPVCKKEFKREGRKPGVWKRQKYCSLECSQQVVTHTKSWVVPQELKVHPRICEGCGAEYYKPYDHSWVQFLKRKLCSRSCPGKGKFVRRDRLNAKAEQAEVIEARRPPSPTMPDEKRIEPRECQHCGEEYSKQHNRSWHSYLQSQYCSVKCAAVAKALKRRRMNTNQHYKWRHENYGEKGDYQPADGEKPDQQAEAPAGHQTQDAAAA